MSKILGISAYYHDSSAAIIIDGKAIAAAQEERFSRKKHTASFPRMAIEFCLEESGLSLDELDAVVFYDKPFLKFERILESYYAFAPKGLSSFLKAIPLWLKEKLFLKSTLRRELKEIMPFDKRKLKILFSEHHLSHAAGAYYPSGFQESAILTIDGVGEWATSSISCGKGKEITLLKELHFPHSLGLLYSSFTYFLGFKVNSGEYKMMGLAPYGERSAKFEEYITIIKKQLVKINDDGSIFLHQDYFQYAHGLKMIHTSKWEKLFQLKRRKESEEIKQEHCDLALAIQTITEEIVLKMATYALSLTGSKNLCFSGGVALNCVANQRLFESLNAEHIYIQPAAGDAGTSMGAALAIEHLYFKQESSTKQWNSNELVYLGSHYTPKEAIQMAKKMKAKYSVMEDKELMATVSTELNEGKIIGWFQGRMEFGPRALGNRSILANPLLEDMQARLNKRIKQRENFRPFAPAVIEEEAKQYFDLEGSSPYMLRTVQLKEELRMNTNLNQVPFESKITQVRSKLAAIIHLDYSARIQTVGEQNNPLLYSLLKAFKDKSGYGVLVNTSFNVRGEPIVESPEDAYRCFMNSGIDILLIGNLVFYKEEQKDFENIELWKLEFTAD